MGVTIAIGMPCRSAALVGNLRKTGTLSSAPAECLREFLSIWQRAAAPFALIGSFFYWPLLARSQGPVPIFRANSYLQSIAVEVTDKRGDGVRGLTPADFTLLENGHPQKIAFFGTEEQPISLTILLDSSGSMKSTQKLKRAQELLRPLLRGNVRWDEISLVPFTNQIGPFVPLTLEQRLNPPLVQLLSDTRKTSSGSGAPPEFPREFVPAWRRAAEPFALSSMHGGTALYDAVAASICRLRGTNIRQAVVVITDGADQNSRLRIDQLIGLVQSSRPQIFMIGFVGQGEADYYRSNGEKVTLVSGREVDNPLRAFQRIAKESGAEAFFPASERELKRVLDRILGMLRAQYTLAYYPENIEKLRRIQVKVQRSGVTVRAPRTVSARALDDESVHFAGGSCEVSPVEHPYAWEPHVSSAAFGAVAYHDDFSDPQSGWPNHSGSHYVPGGYELSGTVTGLAQVLGDPVKLAAFGPWWYDFRASVTVDAEQSNAEAEGMIFRLNERGYYAVLLQGEYFKLVKQSWFNRENVLVYWTRIQTDLKPTKKRIITVECKGEEITVYLDGLRAAQIKDDNFSDGMVGMMKVGRGRVVFQDLQEALLSPDSSR